jgi:Fe-S cluster biogenesis protein NfuA
MFIRNVETPNPNVLRFIFGFAINTGEPISFVNQIEAKQHPLAEGLFTIGGLVSVFIGNDFISIGKDDSVEWFLIKPPIISILMDYTLSGAPIFGENANVIQNDDTKYENLDLGNTDLNDPIIKQIVDIIEERVRPAVAMDGGDIVFRGFKDGIVFVSLHGACSGCPSSSVTLKDGVESMLKHYIPSVLEVKTA